MAADPLENDELLLLKKRARRRLVGAVAFMMVALVILSLVMESRPLPEEKPLHVAIDGLSRTAATPAPSPFVGPAEAQGSAAGSLPAESVPVVQAHTEPVVAPAPTRSLTSKPLVKPPAGTIPAKPVTARTVVVAPNNSTKPNQATAKAGAHTASVIALSNPAKAAELQRKLKAQGLNAYTERIEVAGKTLTRVRVGPYSTRAELEKARAKLALMGL